MHKGQQNVMILKDLKIVALSFGLKFETIAVLPEKTYFFPYYNFILCKLFNRFSFIIILFLVEMDNGFNYFLMLLIKLFHKVN